MMLRRDQLPYCAYYCEENIWHLCQEERLLPGQRHVVLITNASRKALLFEQRAAPGAFVLWDYHVVVFVEGDAGTWVYDLDSRLPFPAAFENYLEGTFGDENRFPQEVRSQFRVVPARAFVEGFASDRSHMKAPDGSWLQPPPVWPAIEGTGPSERWTLSDLMDLARAAPGQWLDLTALRQRFA